MKTLPIALLALALAACQGDGSPDATADVADTDGATGTPANAPVPPATAPPPTEPSTPLPPTAEGRARYDGYGAMRFGMTADAAREAASGELVELGPGGDPQGCQYLNPAGVSPPSHLAFMFEGGRFVRYDVGNDAEVAPGGGKRGMDDDEIRALYPGLTESPHKYVDGGRYLRVQAPDGDGVIVFETDAAGKVSEWHAGLAPQVDYIEGCS